METSLGDLKKRLARYFNFSNDDQLFFPDDEVVDTVNDAILELQDFLVQAKTDYFLKYEDINLNRKAQSIPIPVDCYGSKIREVRLFEKGHVVGQGQRIEKKDYTIVNGASGREILLHHGFDIDATIRVFYTRSVKLLEQDDDRCEIPRSSRYLWFALKQAVYEKEGNPSFQVSSAQFEKARSIIVNSLLTSSEDSSREFEVDMDIYEGYV